MARAITIPNLKHGGHPCSDEVQRITTNLALGCIRCWPCTWIVNGHQEARCRRAKRPRCTSQTRPASMPRRTCRPRCQISLPVPELRLGSLQRTRHRHSLRLPFLARASMRKTAGFLPVCTGASIPLTTHLAGSVGGCVSSGGGCGGEFTGSVHASVVVDRSSSSAEYGWHLQRKRPTTTSHLADSSGGQHPPSQRQPRGDAIARPTDCVSTDGFCTPRSFSYPDTVLCEVSFLKGCFSYLWFTASLVYRPPPKTLRYVSHLVFSTKKSFVQGWSRTWTSVGPVLGRPKTGGVWARVPRPLGGTHASCQEPWRKAQGRRRSASISNRHTYNADYSCNIGCPACPRKGEVQT